MPKNKWSPIPFYRTKARNGSILGEPLSETDSEVVAAFVQLQKELGYNPTVTELAKAMGLGLSTLRARLWRIRAKGVMTWTANRQGTLRLCHENSTQPV